MTIKTLHWWKTSPQIPRSRFYARWSLSEIFLRCIMFAKNWTMKLPLLFQFTRCLRAASEAIYYCTICPSTVVLDTETYSKSIKFSPVFWEWSKFLCKANHRQWLSCYLLPFMYGREMQNTEWLGNQNREQWGCCYLIYLFPTRSKYLWKEYACV